MSTPAYLRDGCLFSMENDIFDKMAAQITYVNGVQVSYSCTTYPQYEGGPGSRSTERPPSRRGAGWRRGSREPWEVPAQDEIRITDNFGQTEELVIPHATGGMAVGIRG